MVKFVTYEELTWVPKESLFYVPRRLRTEENLKYPSAVLDDLSNFNLVFDNVTQKLIQDTIEECSKVEGYLRDKAISLPMLLLRTEALSSSQIENYHSSNRNVALAQLRKPANSQANVISANLNALVYAIYQTKQLSLDAILSIHKILMSNSLMETGGFVRTIPNWIGKSSISPHGADYVPPHPSRLHEYLNHFLEFTNRKDLHPLVVAAFSHAYFETIHPFEDGNGRTGRVLIQMILHQSGFLDHLHIPLSVGLVKNTKEYVEALNAFRDGNYQRIVALFCNSALQVIPMIYEAIARIESVKNAWINSIDARKDAFVWQIIDEIIGQPVIDVAYLVNKYQMNDQAIRNNIDLLLRAGVLRKMNEHAQRSVVYESIAILEILDVFVNDVNKHRASN
jgi:Fic family protein